MLGLGAAFLGSCGPEEETFEDVCVPVCDDAFDCMVPMDEETLDRLCRPLCEIDRFACPDEWKAAAACLRDEGTCPPSLGLLDTIDPGPCGELLDEHRACVAETLEGG